MDRSIFAKFDASVICFGLFLTMLLMLRLGNRLRKKMWHAGDTDTLGGVNALLGALFGLWGFMLAFTFSQSGNRFENVRGYIVDEANMLRTTILKADFFPDSIRRAYRTELRNYLEERIAYYEYANNEAEFRKNRVALTKTAQALWAMTVEHSKNVQLSSAASGMATSLTNLFDIGIKREVLLSSGIPAPISVMLIILVLAICLVGGFTTPTIKRKEWIVIAVFALLASGILYITMDLARPMAGLIKPDAGQAAIVNLRSFFKD